MSQREKMLARLKSKPHDYTFGEARALLENCGYSLLKTGKTGGSRVCFVKGKKVFRMHKPHPRKELLHYQVKELLDELRQEGLL
ncbi:MAG: type II toxin-antitoxin system HicA family toxin [Oscillospiraceae bacterium]|nr:type II toxin-antitoxin system HicA family toxin [Oscillospiraceae bacterium]